MRRAAARASEGDYFDYVEGELGDVAPIKGRLAPTLRDKFSRQAWGKEYGEGSRYDIERQLTKWEMEHAARPFEAGAFEYPRTRVNYMTRKDQEILKAGWEHPQFEDIRYKHRWAKEYFRPGPKVGGYDLEAIRKASMSPQFNDASFWKSYAEGSTYVPELSPWLGETYSGASYEPLKMSAGKRAYISQWSRKVNIMFPELNPFPANAPSPMGDFAGLETHFGGTSNLAGEEIAALTNLRDVSNRSRIWGQGEWASRMARDPYESIDIGNVGREEIQRNLRSTKAVNSFRIHELLSKGSGKITKGRAWEMPGGKAILRTGGTALMMAGIGLAAYEGLMASGSMAQTRSGGTRAWDPANETRFFETMAQGDIAMSAMKGVTLAGAWLLGGPPMGIVAGYMMTAAETGSVMGTGGGIRKAGRTAGTEFTQNVFAPAAFMQAFSSVGNILSGAGRAAGRMFNRAPTVTAEGRPLAWWLDRGARSYTPAPVAKPGMFAGVSEWFNKPWIGSQSWWNPLATRGKAATQAYIWGPISARWMSSGMLDPVRHLDREIMAWTAPEKSPYTAFQVQELNKIGAPAILWKGIQLRREHFKKEGKSPELALLPNLQDIDPGEFLQDPIMQALAAPAALESWYAYALPWYRKNVIDPKWRAGERASKVGAVEATARIGIAAGGAALTLFPFLAGQTAFEYYGGKLLGKSQVIGRIGGTALTRGVGTAAYHFFEAGTYRSPLHLIRTDMSLRAAAFPMATAAAGGSLVAGGLAAAGVSPPVANKLGYAGDIAIMAYHMKQALQARGVADILSAPEAIKNMAKMDKDQAMIYAYEISRFAGRSISSLSAKERKFVNWRMNANDRTFDYFLPGGAVFPMTTNWNPTNLPYKEGSTIKSPASSFTLSDIADRLIGVQLPSSIVIEAAERFETGGAGWPFARAAALSPDSHGRRELMRKALSYGGSPFGASTDRYMESHTAMFENQTERFRKHFKIGRENYVLVRSEALETLHKVTGDDNYYPTYNNEIAAKPMGVKGWEFKRSMEPEEKAKLKAKLQAPRDTQSRTVAETAGAKLISRLYLFPDPTMGGQETVEEAMILELDERRGGGGGGGRRFYPPDPIEMVKGSVSGFNPFGDDLIMAMIGDSIQEWNVRSPRRGGEPYQGDWD